MCDRVMIEFRFMNLQKLRKMTSMWRVFLQIRDTIMESSCSSRVILSDKLFSGQQELLGKNNCSCTGRTQGPALRWT